jgi:hypothetical protein
MMNEEVYVRVSTGEPSREGVFLNTQKAKIVAHCLLRRLTVTEIIQDHGISAKNLKRPGFRKALPLPARSRLPRSLCITSIACFVQQLMR